MYTFDLSSLNLVEILDTLMVYFNGQKKYGNMRQTFIITVFNSFIW